PNQKEQPDAEPNQKEQPDAKPNQKEQPDAKPNQKEQPDAKPEKQEPNKETPAQKTPNSYAELIDGAEFLCVPGVCTKCDLGASGTLDISCLSSGFRSETVCTSPANQLDDGGLVLGAGNLVFCFWVVEEIRSP
ncbi:hypothetical protein AYI68_g4780, partial [Smittium mucronatum]